MKLLLKVAAPLSLFALMNGCVTHRDIRPSGELIDASDLQARRAFSNATHAENDWPAQEWWRSFGDSQLDELVLEGLARNPTLFAAQARVEQARGIALARGGRLSPDLSGVSKISRQRLSENGFFPPPFGGSKFTQFDLGFELQYDFDFWGQNRAAFKSALANARAAEVDSYAARLILAAGVVKTYIQLDRAYALRDLTAATLEQRKQLFELTQKRVQAGLDTQVELKQSDAALPQSEGDLIRVDQQIATLGHQLAALCGQGPDRAEKIGRPRMTLTAPIGLPSSVPADLVGRRPDVVAQRLRVESNLQDIRASEAAFYPNINLAAAVGLQSLSLSDLLKGASHTYAAGPALRLPIFGGGGLRAQLRVSDANYDLAVAGYNDTVVHALQEVADTISALTAIDSERAAADRAVASLQDAYNLAVIRYRAGLSNYLSVLVAEGQVLQQRQLQVDIAARRLDASVSLIRALGGGYQPAPQS